MGKSIIIHNMSVFSCCVIINFFKNLLVKENKMLIENFAQELGQKLIVEQGFEADKDDPNGLYKEIHSRFFLTFGYSAEEKTCIFGFWHTDKIQFSVKQKPKLKAYLKERNLPVIWKMILKIGKAIGLSKKLKRQFFPKKE